MNRATRTVASAMGLILGLSGIDHGIFEILQGSRPTGGMIIQAIGPDLQIWKYGGEEAFTLIPNFLVTGILAVLVGMALMVWSVLFLDRKRGASVFGLLIILLFLVGGGIAAPIVFGPFAWLAATRIRKPLTWGQKTIPESIRWALAPVWPYTVGIGGVSMLIGLYIAITGDVPGVSTSDPERVLTICWSFIFGGGWGMFLLSILSGISSDIQNQLSAS